MFKLAVSEKSPRIEFEEIKGNLLSLMKEIDRLDVIASDSEIKDNLWARGDGDSAINDIDWLYTLQNNICEVTGERPPLDSSFISSLGSFDERVSKIMEYSEILISFIEERIAECDEPLKDLGYDYAWQDFDDCKSCLKKSLSVLEKILSVDDDRRSASRECDKLWKELLTEAERLNKFATYFLRGYDDDSPIDFKMSRAYDGKKKMYSFIDSMIEKLERNKDRFEQNFRDNEEYVRFNEVNPYHF